MQTALTHRIDALAIQGRVRILAFGSSNTERHINGIHWLDAVHLGFRAKYDSNGHFLNTGICGNTTTELLERFEVDAAFFRPHIALLTIGGNDSALSTAEVFERDLHTLWERFDALGTHVVFQTYYAVDSDDSERYLSFYRFSDIVRRVAAETGSSLIDNLARWEPLRKRAYEQYAPLMRDPFHLNERGNKVYGFDIARSLGCPVPHDLGYWAESILLQEMMDELATTTASA